MRKYLFMLLVSAFLFASCGQDTPTINKSNGPNSPTTSTSPTSTLEPTKQVVTKTAIPIVNTPTITAKVSANAISQQTKFPFDFSQAAAAYNSSGQIPQGGQGNVFRFSTGAQYLTSMPALSADGQILVISAHKQGLIALQLDQDFNKIREIWRYKPVEATLKEGFTTTALLYGGLAIAADDSGNLHAVQLSDGKARWVNRDPLRVNIEGTPITDGTNLYFTARTNEDQGMFGPAGGYLYALHITDGIISWRSPKIYGANGTIIFGFDGNLYFGAWDTVLYAYTITGQPVAGWKNPRVGAVATGPQALTQFTYAKDRIWVGSGGVVALDRNGTIVDQALGYGIGTYEAPAVVGDTVYMGNVQANPPIFQSMFEVKALNASNLQQERFTFHTDFPGVANLTVVDGYIYFGAAERFFQVKADGSGQNRQMFRAGNSFSFGNTPVVANGRVYVTNYDGSLYIVK